MDWFAGLATIVVVMILGVLGRPSDPRREDPAVHPVASVGQSPTRPANARPRHRLVVGSAAVVIAVASIAIIGVIATCLLIAIRGAWKRFGTVVAMQRQRRQVEREMPDAIDMFVLIVQSGLTPRQAVEHLAERAPRSIRVGFAAVVAQLDRGDPLADALTALCHEFGTSARALADLVGSADRYGHPLAPILRQLATESRAARRRLDEAAARSLPVKLSFPLVLCTLPSFVLLAIVPAVMAALSSLGDTAP